MTGVDIVIRPATAMDQAFISDMQYEALFVPDGEPPLDRAVLDEPMIRSYHACFGSKVGDLGRIALDPAGTPIGAAWVRQLRGYGYVDDETPELGVAVVERRRGCGIGSALIDDLLVVVPRVSLSVDDRNRALGLYERQGFEAVRRDGAHTVVMLREAGLR